MAVFSFVWDSTYAVGTHGANGTKIIAATVIFLAYLLHPAMKSVFQRVRAYRAWRAIERHQTVEVTRYSMLAGVFGGRGKWDATRTITVLLGVFLLASWGLELSMSLAYYRGDADALNRPPPVTLVNDQDSDAVGYWQVLPKSKFDCEKRGCRSVSNVYDDYAVSMYNVLTTNFCRTGYVGGKIRVGLWSTNAEEAPSLLYYLSGDRPAVKHLQCEEDTQRTQMNVLHGDDRWGSVVECEQGPELATLRNENDIPTPSPPMILLTRSDGTVYLIVEETSNYPSFLYSVWTAGQDVDGFMQLYHEFHIAATTRLVEAVVTGIVHGKASGQYCFKLVRMWSECEDECGSTVSLARPFGEHVTNDTVRVENVETIECGVESNADALLCVGCLAVLTVVGITWCLCMRCKVGADVYDRDELFRAVSVSGVKAGNTPHPAIRVFVRKDHTGKLTVVITDRSNSQIIHPRIHGKGGVNRVEEGEPGPTATRKTQGGNPMDAAEPAPTTIRKQGGGNVAQEAKLERTTGWRQGAVNLVEEDEAAPKAGVASKRGTCSCGAALPPGPTSSDVVSQCHKCSRRAVAVEKGSRKVWVRGERIRTARHQSEPTGHCSKFVAVDVSPVPELIGQSVEHYNTRRLSERRHPGALWDRASDSFFVDAECEEDQDRQRVGGQSHSGIPGAGI